MTALALDVGGTKFAAALVADDGTPVDPISVPVPTTGAWNTCADLLRRVAGTLPVHTVGIASAGPIDHRTGTVAPPNMPDWADGFPLVDAIRSLLGNPRVVLALDGPAALLAEHRLGAARGTDDAIGVVLGTGVGGGLLLGGRVVWGRSGNAGHLGHVISPYGTERCTCGGAGCVETVAGGAAAVRWARAHGWTGRDGVALATDARAGNSIAAAALERAGTAMGQAIASVAAVVDAPFAVVGGGFAESGDLLWRPMIAAAARHARLSFVRELTIVPAQLGALATLTGAAQLTSVTSR